MVVALWSLWYRRSDTENKKYEEVVIVLLTGDQQSSDGVRCVCFWLGWLCAISHYELSVLNLFSLCSTFYCTSSRVVSYETVQNSQLYAENPY